MSESAEKRRKIYAEYLKYNSKPTCIIHGPGHSLYEFKVLGDFGYKDDKSIHNMYRGQNPANRRKFNRQQGNNDIANSAVDKILLQENQKVNADNGAYENIESGFNENKIYQIYNMSLDTKEKLKWSKRAVEYEQKIHMILKIRMVLRLYMIKK